MDTFTSCEILFAGGLQEDYKFKFNKNDTDTSVALKRKGSFTQRRGHLRCNKRVETHKPGSVLLPESQLT